MCCFNWAYYIRQQEFNLKFQYNKANLKLIKGKIDYQMFCAYETTNLYYNIAGLSNLLTHSPIHLGYV